MDVNQIIDFIVGPYTYHFFLLVMILCGFGLPLNADLIMLSLGALSGMTELHPVPLYFLAIIGLNIGDSTIFLLGQRFGFDVFRLWPISSLIKPRRVKKLVRAVKSRGPSLIFTVRFVPGTRTVSILASGIFKISYYKFLPANILAISILAAILIFGGNLLFSSVQQATENLSYFLIGFLIIASIVFFASKKFMPKNA